MPLEVDSVTLVVMAADNCNLTCRYCSTPNDSLAEVPPEALEKALTGLQTLFGTVYVGLSGGEPTLHSRFGELLDVIASCEADFYLVTNGVTFERVLPLLLRHRERLTHVMFSLEGADREFNDRIRGTGCFDAVTEGLWLCHEHGIRMSLGCALNRGNLGQIDALIRLAEERMVVDGVYCWPAFATRALVEDGLVLTEADRAYLTEKAEGMADRNLVIFGDLFRFDTLYRECAPLSLRQFTLNADGNLTFCCNLTLYLGETGKADELGAVAEHEISRLVEAHIDHAKEYQKKLLRDVMQDRPKGLAAYPCFHCQRYHGKLDWMADAVRRRQQAGQGTVGDGEMVQEVGRGN